MNTDDQYIYFWKLDIYIDVHSWLNLSISISSDPDLMIFKLHNEYIMVNALTLEIFLDSAQLSKKFLDYIPFTLKWLDETIFKLSNINHIVMENGSIYDIYHIDNSVKVTRNGIFMKEIVTPYKISLKIGGDYVLIIYHKCLTIYVENSKPIIKSAVRIKN
jgi:hypothetical protein